MVHTHHSQYLRVHVTFCKTPLFPHPVFFSWVYYADLEILTNKVCILRNWSKSSNLVKFMLLINRDDEKYYKYFYYFCHVHKYNILITTVLDTQRFLCVNRIKMLHNIKWLIMLTRVPLWQNHWNSLKCFLWLADLYP